MSGPPAPPETWEDTPRGSCTPPLSLPRYPREVVAHMQRLHELHKRGGLTDAEFQQAKQQLLDSSSSSTTRSRGTGRRRGRPRRRRPPRKRASRDHADEGPSVPSSRSRSWSPRSSASSTSADHFFVLQRPKVWRTLHDDHSLDEDPRRGPAAREEGAGTCSRLFSPRASFGTGEAAWGEEKGESGAAAGRGPPGETAAPVTGVPILPHETREARERSGYGTFSYLRSAYGARLAVGGGGKEGRARVPLHREEEVHLLFFNSRGARGTRFGEVELAPADLRLPHVLPKAGGSPVHGRRERRGRSTAPLKPDDAAPPSMPPAADREGGLPRLSKSSSSASGESFLEQSLNWYWIDVTGRDPSRQRYSAALRFLTQRFHLCESFLVDPDHSLLLPQICESPVYRGQYLINLRVATPTISISDDSVSELTNRWIIVVDLLQHLVITLHRVDTRSMALLRAQWAKVMRASEVSFQEFLLKIIDDAIQTYQLSLEAHTHLLDRCESRLFVSEKPIAPRAGPMRKVDLRILEHFSGSSPSPFLQKLLDETDTSAMNKGKMNSFLHHLHRRTSVQHRMLNHTQGVLAEGFTKLRLCSKELSSQMCAACTELSDRALEIREDSKSLLDLHIALQSFRTNELMAVLTRVSLFFTPCTFLAGVYGMNFRYNMHELSWVYGYPFFWFICLLLVIGMHVYFLRSGLTS